MRTHPMMWNSVGRSPADKRLAYTLHLCAYNINLIVVIIKIWRYHSEKKKHSRPLHVHNSLYT